MKSNLVIILLLISLKIFATDYYVTNEGDDGNNGKSPQSGFATIKRVNQLKLKPGDRILFKKGDVFPGELVINQSGKAGKPIIISTYGEKDAAKPVIIGASTLIQWKKEQGNLYSAHAQYTVKQLFANGKSLCPGRLPNEGYFFIDEDGDRMVLKDKELDKYDNLEGSKVRIQTVNWQWEIRQVAEKNPGKIKLDSLLWHPTKKNFGYYLENKLAFVDKFGEWYYNEQEGRLYIMWEGNINNVEFQAVCLEDGIKIRNGLSNIEIKGVSIKYYNNAAINIGERSSGISISGNEISNIEVFGILMNKGCEVCHVSNNAIADIQGRGISTLEPQNCKISSNHIKRIGMIAGHGFDGVNSGVGICMENRENQKIEEQVIAMNNEISKNKIDSTGYGGIRADGAYNTIEYNVVREAVLTMNDGAGIYSWGKNYNYSHHNVFRNNIVVNVHGNTESSAGHHKIICALYLDNYSNNHVVEDNIFVCDETGIILNDLSHSHIIRGNKIYGSKCGISYSVWRINDLDTTIRGNYHLTNNVIYSKGGNSRIIDNSNEILVDYEMGVIDSNVYISPFSDDLFRIMKNYGSYKVSTDYTIEAWRHEMGYDLNSRVIIPKPGSRTWEMEDNSIILINDREVPKPFDLGNEIYTNKEGNRVFETILVQPFEAEILFKR